jgi:hypothetical protein
VKVNNFENYFIYFYFKENSQIIVFAFIVNVKAMMLLLIFKPNQNTTFGVVFGFS